MDIAEMQAELQRLRQELMLYQARDLSCSAAPALPTAVVRYHSKITYSILRS